MEGRQSVQTSASASQCQSGESPGQGQDPHLQGHLPHLEPNDFELELDEPRLSDVHHSYLEIF